MESLGIITFKRENGMEGDDLSEDEYLGGFQGMWASEKRILRKEQFITSNAKERSSEIQNKNNIFILKIIFWNLKLVYGIRNWQEQVQQNRGSRKLSHSMKNE